MALTLAEYKKLSTNGNSTVKVIDLELPSGFVMQVRPFPLEQYAKAGRLPHLFIEQSANAIDKKEVGAAEIMSNLSGKDFLESAEFIKKIFEYCCVSPRICVNPTGDDEIAPEEMQPADLEYLQMWCMSGGVAMPLSDFRPEPDKPLASRAHKPKLPPKTVGDIEGSV